MLQFSNTENNEQNPNRDRHVSATFSLLWSVRYCPAFPLAIRRHT